MLLLVLSVHAQGQAPADPSGATTQPTTVLKVYSRRVAVDVVVTDAKGRPVRDLTRDEFKVFEDGQEQAVRSFDAHVLVHQATPAQPPPAFDLPPHTYANLVRAPEDGPVTVLLYDVLNTPIQVMPYAHNALVKFIKNQPPGSRTAIFVLGDKLRMLEGFTDDETRLLTAINSKSAASQQSTLLLNGATSSNPATDIAEPNPQVPVDPNATGPTSILGELNSMEQMEELMQIQERIDATAEAFAEIARFLSALPGRKNLLWLSGSFPGSVLPSSDPAASGTSAEFGMTLNSDREIKIANDLLNAAHVSVYPVDVRGLQTDSLYSASNNTHFAAGKPPKSTFNDQQNAEHGTMDEIADNTGGHAFYNTNGLGQAMQEAIDQGSVYYTLTYSPTNAKSDGAMRKIRVQLDKSGYQLSYRKSYFADVPGTPVVGGSAATSGDTATAPDPIVNDMRHGAPISSELFFEASVLPLQGAMQANPREMAQLQQFAAKPSKKALPDAPMMVQHYEVSYSILGRLLNMDALPNGKFNLQLTFALAAFDGDGLLLNGLEIHVKDPIAAAEHNQIKAGGYHTKLTVAVPPAARWLRIAVQDVAGGRTGSIEVPLDGK